MNSPKGLSLATNYSPSARKNPSDKSGANPPIVFWVKLKLLSSETIAKKLSLKQIRERIKEAEPKEFPSLKKEFQDISKRMLNSSNWNNPKKVKKIATLLKQLEALLID